MPPPDHLQQLRQSPLKPHLWPSLRGYTLSEIPSKQRCCVGSTDVAVDSNISYSPSICGLIRPSNRCPAINGNGADSTSYLRWSSQKKRLPLNKQVTSKIVPPSLNISRPKVSCSGSHPNRAQFQRSWQRVQRWHATVTECYALPVRLCGGCQNKTRVEVSHSTPQSVPPSK